MSLPDHDIDYLNERGNPYEISVDAGMTCILLPNYSLPVGYDVAQSDLLLRLSPGYPDVPPDMWWFNPGIRLLDGRSIPGTEASEVHFGKPWQRWSRHFNPGQWKSGVDSLESFFALIRREVERCVRQPVR